MARTPMTVNSATGMALIPAPLVRTRPRAANLSSGQPVTPAKAVATHFSFGPASSTAPMPGGPSTSSQPASASATAASASGPPAYHAGSTSAGSRPSSCGRT